MQESVRMPMAEAIKAEDLPQGKPGAEAAARPSASRRLGRRMAAFAFGLVCAVSLSGVIATALLLWLTPSPRTAEALVRIQAKLHGSAYPGPPPPPRFVKALLATEDHRFYSFVDPGLDPVAVVRVAIDIARGRRGDLGGSTIEQQLAKMLYTPTSQHSFASKVVQVAIGVKMRFMYSKEQILTMYSQVVYFGDGHYGLERASCGYFGKEPEALNWTQATMLAGVVNGPSVFDPRQHPQAARRRQAHVFKRLVAVGALTRQQARDAMEQPLDLTHKRCRRSAAGCCADLAKPASAKPL